MGYIVAPRPEDFGLDREGLERRPRPWVAEHRGPLLLGTVVVLLVAAAATVAVTTRSLAATVFFTPVVVLASLILVAPLATVILFAAGRLEERWRSHRDPDFDRFRRFREAEEGYRRDLGRLLVDRSERDLAARDAGDPLLEAVLAEIGRAVVTPLEREAYGADLLAVTEDRRILVRVEPRGLQASAGAGRELAMAALDLVADEALLVAPGGVTPTLAAYATDHGLRVVTE